MGYCRGELGLAGISDSIFVPILRNAKLELLEFGQTKFKIFKNCVPVWLSGRALRQQRKRLWVRYPVNTNTD